MTFPGRVLRTALKAKLSQLGFRESPTELKQTRGNALRGDWAPLQVHDRQRHGASGVCPGRAAVGPAVTRGRRTAHLPSF
jgi:hypothetical protein